MQGDSADVLEAACLDRSGVDEGSRLLGVGYRITVSWPVLTAVPEGIRAVRRKR